LKKGLAKCIKHKTSETDQELSNGGNLIIMSLFFSLSGGVLDGDGMGGRGDGGNGHWRHKGLVGNRGDADGTGD